MHLEVAAACIVNDRGEVLCVKRGASKFPSTAYRWEFPGGKIEPRETPAQAAVREIAEELNLAIEPLADGPTLTHTYPEFTITLHTILAAVTPDSPPLTLHEHIDHRWLKADHLWQLDFAAADAPLLLWLKERTFGSFLRTNTFGRSCTFLHTCTSTNDLLLKAAEAGVGEGTTILSETQTAGRGRLGREWLSLPGQALLFSFLVCPTCPPDIAATITLVAGIAVTQALRALGLPAGLKWPNDVLIDEKKVCGILCEGHSTAKGLEGIIIGIGINTGAVPEAVAHRATTLQPLQLDRLQLLATFFKTFEPLYATWSEHGLAALATELADCDCKRNQPITIKQGDTPLAGIARGIQHDGALLLEKPDGTLQSLYCGEIVQWD